MNGQYMERSDDPETWDELERALAKASDIICPIEIEWHNKKHNKFWGKVIADVLSKIIELPRVDNNIETLKEMNKWPWQKEKTT